MGFKGFPWSKKANAEKISSALPSDAATSTGSFSEKGPVTPFPGAATPSSSRARSLHNVARRGPTAAQARAAPKPFKSSRLVGEYEKPWLSDKHYNVREWADKFILGFCAIIGVAITAYMCIDGWNQLPVFDYCLILDDEFSTLNSSTWSREVGVGGFGYGSFDWTTADPLNSYVAADGLHIVPTLTTETTNITLDQLRGIGGNYTVNLTADGTCTSPAVVQCVITANSTNGTIINPVRSARLTTANKVSIKYGRVEVVAKMPKGDWLWPSIWMYPEAETYGPWPRSGEIDIAMVRGNAPSIVGNGRDTVTSALHWGSYISRDEVARTTGNMTIRRRDLSDGFHTFGMEWSDQHFFTWIDNRNTRVTETRFGSKYGTMWDRAEYLTRWYKANGTDTWVLPLNAWSQTGAFNTPFDKPFHLILNVAVGAQNGFFDNSLGNKPWVDGSGTAMKNFQQSQQQWYSSWGNGSDHGMTVKSVKMWQQGKCGGGS